MKANYAFFVIYHHKTTLKLYHNSAEDAKQFFTKIKTYINAKNSKTPPFLIDISHSLLANISTTQCLYLRLNGLYRSPRLS